MQKIALSKGVWFYDPAKLLGKSGGFGAVYEGFSSEHGELAVKRLHLKANEAAHREMRVASDLATRPSLERVRALLNEVIQSPSTSPEAGFGVLAQAGVHIAHAEAEAQRAQQQQLSEAEARNQLAEAGRLILGAIIERLLGRIQSEAPNAARKGFAITLGKGAFEISLSGTRGYRPKAAIPADAFKRSGWDVVATEEIVVHQEVPQYQWSASLWYCRLPGRSDYRWYEASYFSVFKPSPMTPYALSRNLGDADLAASPVTHVYQLAFGPTEIDDEDEDEFTERWAALLGLGSQGKLGYPRRLPLAGKFWREQFVV